MPHPQKGYSINGVKVPGVTTIISRFKEAGGLLHWAFEQGKACERGEINSLYDKRDSAGESGTLAHALVEAYIDKRPLPDISKEETSIAAQAIQGFENFKQWHSESNIEIISQEGILVSSEYMFGGCPDAIGKNSRGEFCLLDWKTSNGIYSDYLLQLAAYGYLWNSNNPDNPITGGFHLCRFSKESADFSHHYWSELDDAWEQFKLFRIAYDIDKKLKKRV